MVAAPGTPHKAYHVGSRVWLPAEGPAASGRQLQSGKGGQEKFGGNWVTAWVKGHVVKLVQKDGDLELDVQVEGQAGSGAVIPKLHPGNCPLQNERDDDVEDLTASDFLHEPGILHTLQVRYTLDSIYTYSGNILIAVNPHKRLRHLYGARMMTQYRGLLLGDLSPHVYAIAEQAFALMMMDKQPQSVLISGESGAGKTETAKLVMQYLAQRGQAANPGLQVNAPGTPGSDAGTAVPIEEQVLESNPLLEAFGNAKTSRNDNSSRFGKFVEIGFDEQGRVMGASISTFLLERSRVVGIASPERSYHIFYQLCSGATPAQRKALHLEGGASSFRFLNASNVKIEGVDDAEAFKQTCHAMQIVGLDDDDMMGVFTVVAVVLHLGNIVFQSSGGGEESTIPDMASVDVIAELLQVEPRKLTAALLTRTIETVGEKIVKPLNPRAAAESRDALAKTMYGALFDWLVGAINKRIDSLGSGISHSQSIGILDIYGFESFTDNSFEQLCINLANERLQQQFNQHVFKEEQDEYQREGIDWTFVKFVDNQETLDLLEGFPQQPALGVFPLLDEACRLPKATASDLAHTLRSRLNGKPRFDAPKRHEHCFNVLHYAGEVMYNTALLLDKNRDYLVAEHLDLFSASTLPLLGLLFPSNALPAAADSSKGRRAGFKLATVGDRFRKQLQILANTLNKTNPHYIRCVKPNAYSKPGSLDPAYTLEQLRAGGVLEAVRIACAGFPTRKPHAVLLARYGLLLQALPAEEFSKLRSVERSVQHGLEVEVDTGMQKHLIAKLLKQQGLEGWQLGITRVFLRSGQLAQLEGIRGVRLAKAAVIIQSAGRMFIARRRYKTNLQRIARVQAICRGRKVRKGFNDFRRGVAATRIQAFVRMSRARQVFMKAVKEKRATTIQAWARMILVRLKFHRETEAGRRASARARKAQAAVAVQKYARRWLAGQKLERLKREAARLADLQQATETLRDEAEEAKRNSDLARSERDAAQMETATHQARAAQLEAEVDRMKLELKAVKAANQGADQQQVEMQVKAAVAEAAEKQRGQLEKQLAEQREALLHGATALRDAEASMLERDDLVKDLKQQIANLHKEVAARAASLERHTQALEGLRTELNENKRKHEEEVAAMKLERVKLRDDLELAKTEVHVQAARVRQESADHVASVRAEAEKSLDRERARHKETQKRYYLTSASVVELKKELAEHTAHNSRATPSPGVASARVGLRKGSESLQENGMASFSRALTGPQLEAVQILCGAALRQGLLGRGFVTMEDPRMLAGREVISFPIASWWLARALIQWRAGWPVAAFDGAKLQVLSELREVAIREKANLRSQGAMLATSIALSGLLATASGCTDMRLQQYSNKLLQMEDLHGCVCDAICQIVQFSPRLIGSNALRRRGNRSVDMRMSPEAGNGASPAAPSDPWDELREALDAVLSTLRDDAGLPPPAVQAVLSATLAYLDAELMNDLMTRRQSCSTSALKVLQHGMSIIREWAGAASEWTGGVQGAEAAMRHVTQSVRYLLVAKDDITRKHVRAMDIMQDLVRVCPSLTFQQVLRLTQCHHDDFVGHEGSTTGPGQLLLRWVQQKADKEPLGLTIQQISNPSRLVAASPSQAQSGNGDENDSLLLDPRAALKFSPTLLKAAAKVYADPAIAQGARTRIMGLPLPADMEACPELLFLCA